ncbi:Hydroxyethylthiazole kinase [Peniophora sp. CONT]|nr:Hydroxyethylthiazole kinase [Peniophora sp. CONT]
MVAVDYSVYLVTGRELLPPNKTYLGTLEEALRGGVTLVQVREKDTETREFLRIAQQTIELCNKFNVPVLINDRIDIALASGAAGVHLGQDDMPIEIARKLLPSGSIIGITTTTAEHVRAAVSSGADYVGVGAVFPTATKDVSEPGRVRGVEGVREMMEELEGSNVKSVAIGGVKSTNLTRVLHGCSSARGLGLDGVAVVSDIMAAQDPRAAAERLASIYRAWRSVPRIPTSFSKADAELSSASFVELAGKLLEGVRAAKPLVHQITNGVVKTQSANATLALGASPIMAASAQEQVDLARIPGGLLINFGTIEDVQGMLIAGTEANKNRKPVVFDPVGVGATAYRRETASKLLNAWQATVIKGNAAEIGTIARLDEVKGQGVDSIGDFKDPVSVVRRLALRERCIVVLSGVTDYITDGHRVVQLSNGHPLLGQITGSGCMLGTAVTTFCGTASVLAEREPTASDAGVLAKGDMLVAAAAGVLALTIAAELAAERPEVRGPGTFLPVLLDELSRLTPETLASRAKAKVVT